MKTKKRLLNKSGFSLIEAMVTSVLMTVVIMLSSDFLIDLTKKNKLTQNKTQKESLISSWGKMQTKYFTTLMLSFYDPSMSFYSPSASSNAVCPLPQNRRALYDHNWVKIGVPVPPCASLNASALSTDFTLDANSCATTTVASRPTCSPWRSVTRFDSTGGFSFSVGGESVSNFRGNSTDLIVWRPLDNTDPSAGNNNNNNSGPTIGNLGYELDRILLSRCVDPSSALPQTFAQVMAMPRLIYHGGHWKCCPAAGTYLATAPQAGYGNDPSSCTAITTTALSGSVSVLKLSSTQYWPTIVMLVPDASFANIKFIPSMVDRQLMFGQGFFISFSDYSNPSSYKVHSLAATNECDTKFVNSQTRKCPALNINTQSGAPFTNFSTIISELNSYSLVKNYEHRADTLQNLAGSSVVRFGTRSQISSSNNNNSNNNSP